MKPSEFISQLQRQIRLVEWEGVYYNLDAIIKVKPGKYGVKLYFGMYAPEYCQPGNLWLYLSPNDFKCFLKKAGIL